MDDRAMVSVTNEAGIPRPDSGDLTPRPAARWSGAGPEDDRVTGRSTPWPESESCELTSVHGRAAIKRETRKRIVGILSAEMVREGEPDLQPACAQRPSILRRPA